MNPELCGASWSVIEMEAAQDAFAADGLATYRPDLIGFRDGETVCHWDSEMELFGKFLPPWLQKIGTCVGMAFGRAMQDSIFNAICSDQFGYPVEVAWEPTYSIARTAKDIGNKRMGNDPSGNYPSWFARAFRFYGVAVRKMYGTIDLRTQREGLAAQWATSSTPVQIVEENRNWPAAACFWPQSVDEVLGAIRAGYGVGRATNRCTNPKRQKNGYSGLIPSKGHAQGWRAVIVDKHGEPFVGEGTSWPLSQAPHGEYEIEDISGRPIELPDGVGLLNVDDIKYCLKNGEVVAVACPENLPREKP